MSSTVYKTIKDRRSIRKYQLKEVSDNILLRIFDAARWTPSAHNAQPWRIIVIKDPVMKQKLAKAMASEWERDLSDDGVAPEDRERLVKSSIEQFTQAPTLFVVCLTMEDMGKYPDERRQEAEHIMAVQSVAAAIQNMLLAAHAEGLGACWFCAPLFCPETVKEVLEAPKDIEPQALITLGYPAERPEPPPRKSLKSIVYQNYWGHRG